MSAFEYLENKKQQELIKARLKALTNLVYKN